MRLDCLLLVSMGKKKTKNKLVFYFRELLIVKFRSNWHEKMMTKEMSKAPVRRRVIVSTQYFRCWCLIYFLHYLRLYFVYSLLSTQNPNSQTEYKSRDIYLISLRSQIASGHLTDCFQPLSPNHPRMEVAGISRGWQTSRNYVHTNRYLTFLRHHLITDGKDNYSPFILRKKVIVWKK